MRDLLGQNRNPERFSPSTSSDSSRRSLGRPPRSPHQLSWAPNDGGIEQVIDKVVQGVDHATTAFVIELQESRWLLVYLDPTRLRWRTGKGSPAKFLRKHGENPFCGDGYTPPRDRTPRSEHFCDLGHELRRSRTARLQRLEFSSEHVTLVFKGGTRLQAHVSRDAIGRNILRAFWDGRGKTEVSVCPEAAPC